MTSSGHCRKKRNTYHFTFTGAEPCQATVALRQRGVEPLSIGQVIVATWHPHETTVVEVIRDLGLELHVIFNKGAVMVLPSGVNKATGLQAALRELGLSPHNTVGVGDAENDHAFLSLCECAVAVANALPAVRERVDWVTKGDHGTGVIELIDKLVAADLGELAPLLKRHHITLGRGADGQEVYLPSYGDSVLLAGSSGSGKSTLATGILERLVEQGYQCCIIDPEGDYATFEGMVVLGDPQRPPSVDELLTLVENPEQNAVVNLLGIALEHRPTFFKSLLPRLQELRARTGRPHWIVVDEAHHLLPAGWEQAALVLPQALHGMLLITVHPDHIAPTVLASVQTIIAVGEAPEHTILSFGETLGQPVPALAPTTLAPGEALCWARRTKAAPYWFRSAPRGRSGAVIIASTR